MDIVLLVKWSGHHTLRRKEHLSEASGLRCMVYNKTWRRGPQAPLFSTPYIPTSN
jgi:hypothetical protein